ncbi:MAG: hypothetical protein M3511_12790 [Deinococcota bacterium]|jgi:hypothetical protein|nr:hypothetical protein [Deinococcota bacterium]
MYRHGYSEVLVKLLWGDCRLRIAKWRCGRDGLVVTAYPAGMDRSGLSPEVLKRCLDLNTRLPYREGHEALSIQGLDVGLSRCERLSQRYGEIVVETLEQWVSDKQVLEADPYELPKGYVIELDGVMVMEQDKPVEGQCEGREVKQALVHPLGDSSRKEHIAQALTSDDFEAWTQALLKQAGVKKQDYLIGIADGSAWIDEAFASLGVKQRILDVFHATLYLDTVMKALGYDESTRQAQRASWYRGDIDARVWLKHHVEAKQHDTSTWPQQALSALSYLDKRLDQMDYWSFREKGYPIGSGAIEGANKSVVGARMKRSGMRWSKQGINRMAAMRSLQTTANPWLDFHSTRLAAFN